MSALSHELLKNLLHYEPDAGVFTWKVSPAQCVPKGSVAGTIMKIGYCAVKIQGTNYRAQRLAFFYMMGRWPSRDIDHIDGNKQNNRWVNLREATRSQNGANRGMTKKNSSGYKGVAWDEKLQKWRAAIGVNYRRIHLGLFESADQASTAYLAAARQHFGEFARK